MSTKLTVGNISQYTQKSNHCTVDLNLVMLYVNYFSIKKKKKHLFTLFPLSATLPVPLFHLYAVCFLESSKQISTDLGAANKNLFSVLEARWPGAVGRAMLLCRPLLGFWWAWQPVWSSGAAARLRPSPLSLCSLSPSSTSSSPLRAPVTEFRAPPIQDDLIVT